MRSVEALITAVLVLIIAPFIIFEGLRFYSAHKVCVRKWASNAMLVNNTICKDLYEMYSHGDKQVEACARAKSENLVGPVACAWQTMWVEGYGHGVVATVTDSPWMIFGLASIGMTSTIWMLFRSCRGSGERVRHQESSPDTALVKCLVEALRNSNSYQPHHQEPQIEYYEQPPPPRRRIKLVERRERLNMVY